ncbi:MAG: hypothetical protein AAF487_02610 [Bacteroidota bacterium]
MQRLGKILGFAALLALLLSSCRDPVQFPTIPAVEYKSFEILADTAFLTFDMTDGDGNFGLDEEDTLGDFEFNAVPFNKFHYCIFIDPYKFVNNEWVLIDKRPNAANPDAIPLYYRVERLDPSGSDKNLEAEIRIDFPPPVWPLPECELGDTIKFQIQIADRELQESNVAESPAFIIQ